jgi:hypothetical protein
MSIWVVNTSSLVFLGNLALLELLRHEGRLDVQALLVTAATRGKE